MRQMDEWVQTYRRRNLYVVTGNRQTDHEKIGRWRTRWVWVEEGGSLNGEKEPRAEKKEIKIKSSSVKKYRYTISYHHDVMKTKTSCAEKPDSVYINRFLTLHGNVVSKTAKYTSSDELAVYTDCTMCTIWCIRDARYIRHDKNMKRNFVFISSFCNKCLVRLGVYFEQTKILYH